MRVRARRAASGMVCDLRGEVGVTRWMLVISAAGSLKMLWLMRCRSKRVCCAPSDRKTARKVSLMWPLP
jgi:hypothetical protein